MISHISEAKQFVVCSEGVPGGVGEFERYLDIEA